jgi:molybdopterin converting factor small subunit
MLVADGMVSQQHFEQNMKTFAESLEFANGESSNRASLITIKVYYSMMAEYTNLEEEDFVLQAPAEIQGLINTVVVRHPSMATMMSAMLILLNGIPSKPTVTLTNGDVVQFIPMAAGG